MRVLGCIAIAAVGLAGCGEAGDKRASGSQTPNASPSAGAAAPSGLSGAASGPTGVGAVIHVEVGDLGPDRPCEPGNEGRTIPSIDTTPMHVDPKVVPDQKLGDATVPGFTIPGVDVASLHIPEQCARIDPAPAGCLGAMHIPPASIPSVTLPAVRIPGVSVRGATAMPVAAPAATAKAVRTHGVSVKEVCRRKVRRGEIRPGVIQGGIIRGGVIRGGVIRGGVIRGGACDDAGHCIPAVSVASVSLPSEALPSMSLPSRSLESKVFPEVRSKCVRVFAGKRGDTAYNVCSDVLFAFDRATIRPQAATALRQVAASLKRRFAGRAIQVDGHTDAVGGDAYNERLSERRAASVKRWLVQHGGIAGGRISTGGYGESKPVATNATKAGRQQNRRVVVGVRGE